MPTMHLKKLKTTSKKLQLTAGIKESPVLDDPWAGMGCCQTGTNTDGCGWLLVCISF